MPCAEIVCGILSVLPVTLDSLIVLRSTATARGVNSILTLGGARDFFSAELEIALRKITYMR